MKIVADDKIPFLRGVLEPYADIVYMPGGSIRRDDLADAGALLIRTRTRCTESLLNGTSIKFIGTATIGFDHIDTAWCSRNNITWTNAPGCNSSSVQQYITAALLKLEHDHQFILKGKKLGIIGAGNVGSKVEKAAKALEMSVLVNDPPRARKEGSSGFVELETLLQESDIISLHVPLNIVGTDQTYHLFNDEILGKVRNGAWFINSSRGEVAETSALRRALKEGKLAGAILDVWENEPDLDKELMFSSFIATPHIAGYSTDGKANGTAMVINSLCKHFGLPLQNWYPHDIPEPDSPFITINCSGKSDSDILREAVIHTYDINEDDTRFRRSPSDFEKQRGDYRLRREFSAYTVELTGGTAKMSETLKKLGFRAG